MGKLVLILLAMFSLITVSVYADESQEPLDDGIEADTVGDFHSTGGADFVVRATGLNCPANLPFYQGVICGADNSGGSKGRLRMRFYCSFGRLVGSDFEEIYITTGSGNPFC